MCRMEISKEGIHSGTVAPMTTAHMATRAPEKAAMPAVHDASAPVARALEKVSMPLSLILLLRRESVWHCASAPMAT